MVYCFQHPDYRGQDAPVISCKTCCHLFIKEVKRCRDAGEPLPLQQQKENFKADPALSARRRSYAVQSIRGLQPLKSSLR